jgi:H/ACA ribonucleoprotein complex subunit 4
MFFDMGNSLPFEGVKRELLVRKDAGSDPAYGVDPEKRPIPELLRNGFVNIDKPPGPTSHQVSAWARHIASAKKAGHAGTLDPAVTGVLPIAFDNAAKVLKALLYAGKEYVALMHLHGDVSEAQVKDAFKGHVGKITQLPPLRSNVKRVLREREIYYIQFLEKKDRDVLFKVGCQAGTYIRRLCEQLGKELEVGAHMAELRRTKAAGFTEQSKLVTLQDLSDAVFYWKEEGNERFLRYCVQPVESALKHVSRVWVFDETVESLCLGAKLAIPGISKLESGISNGDLVQVLSIKGELVGLGTALLSSEDVLNQQKGLAVKMDRIVMKAGTYPRFRPGA